jgi:hypothetical protein
MAVDIVKVVVDVVEGGRVVGGGCGEDQRTRTKNLYTFHTFDLIRIALLGLFLALRECR